MGWVPKIDVIWITRADNGDWLPLELADLSQVDVVGVYVIWFRGQGHNIVRVGQGRIAQRLTEHRNDPQVLAFKNSGPLFVTWAELPAQYLDGVERYLADTLHPLIGDVFPAALPIAVNLPGQ